MMAKYRNVRPFKKPAQSVGGLDAEIVANLIASATDISLLVDSSGVIQDVSSGIEHSGSFDFLSWLGMPWIETVAPDSKHKVEELLSGATSRSPTLWREINHATSSGDQLLVRYSAMQAKSDGTVIVLGQSLRYVAELQRQLLNEQAANEAEYARLRQTELRYRLMFQMAAEATIIAEALTGKVAEANPVAWAILGVDCKKEHQHAHHFFSSKDTSTIKALISSPSDSVKARLAGTETEVIVSPTSFQLGGTAYVLLRLVRIGE